MTQGRPGRDDALHPTLDLDPPATFRAELGQLINAFHSETVPHQPRRFALSLTNDEGGLAGGLSGVIAWQWLFVEALWVDPAWRGRGAGRALMARAEHHALAEGCHSVWLDSFQAAAFYQTLGYEVFATLENYPAAQRRSFLRKCLKPA